ncbi:MAG TPA: DUF418 domain-containing protein [Sphingomicrobium sp.]
MAELASAPRARRIESLDFIRGCALFGILLMNIVGMGLGPAYDNPTVLGGDTGINLQTWYFYNVGFEGTQRGLFSILFGAGIILFSSRAEESGRPDHADLYVRRQLWLILFGLINAWLLLWYGDILYFYGITALFLYAFRKLSGKVLLALGIGAFVLGAAWTGLETSNLLAKHALSEQAANVPEADRTEAQNQAISDWERSSSIAPPPDAVEQMMKDNRAGYLSAQRSLAPTIIYFETWILFRYFFDIFGMMMIGMALFKLGILTLERSTHIYLAMMIGGYGIGLPLNLYEANWIMANDFSGLAYHQANITYDFSRLTMTTGHLGLLLLFVRSGWFGILRRSMAAVGRMALTNYLTHSVVALIIFYLLGYWGTLERHQLYYIVFTVWLVQIVVSPIWLKYFHFGPVEWVWRYLTYLKAPPFRKSDPGARIGVTPAPAG